MGDVYWMTGFLIAQAIISTVICIVLSMKTESVTGEPRDSEIEQ